MARHRLAESRIPTLQKPGIYSDGDGLFLRVRAGGSRQFLFIYRRGKVRTEIGLGGYGQGTAPVSLALARKKAEEIRGQLARGEDPRAGRLVRATFKDMMESTIAVKEQDFRNAKHKAQWAMTLDRYAAPLHDIPVADITVDNIVTTLEPIWQRIPETADRLRMRIEAVLDHAKARGLRTGDNPAEWKGNLKHLLPARQKLSRGHHAALQYRDMPVVISRLRASKGVSALAVEFVTLTAARSGEARFATWNEIDFQEKLWTIPPDRMKAGKEHRVPLTDRAIEILEIMKQRATGDLVFGGERDGRPISDVAMTKALRRASGDDSTLHGLRSTFRDLSGTLNVGEAQSALRAISSRHYGRSFQPIIMAASIAIGAAAGFGADLISKKLGLNPSLEWPILIAAVVVSAIVAGRMCQRWSVKRFRQTMQNRGMPTTFRHSLSLRDDDLEMQTEWMRQIAPWSSVTEIIRSGSYWIFMIGVDPWFAPSRYFSSAEDERNFIAIAITHSQDAVAFAHL